MYTNAQVKEMNVRAGITVSEGEEWYKKIAEELEKKHVGQYVIINVEDGQYVVAEDEVRVIQLAEKEFGTPRRTFFRKIGEPYPEQLFPGRP